jgi:RNA-directed DNA polymerase
VSSSFERQLTGPGNGIYCSRRDTRCFTQALLLTSKLETLSQACIAAAGQHLLGRTGSRLERRGLRFSRYVGSEAAERVLESIREWIEKHMRLQLNATKRANRRPWERKFLGVPGEPPDANRSSTGKPGKIPGKGAGEMAELSEPNQQPTEGRLETVQPGWWGYYRLAENRQPIFEREGRIRRRIRAFFWQPWHGLERRE